MKHLIALIAALLATQAGAAEYITGIIRTGERIFLTDKPCIYNGRPYYTLNAAAKHVMSKNRMIDGCYVTKGAAIYFKFNDGDEGWIPAHELEFGGR